MTEDGSRCPARSCLARLIILGVEDWSHKEDFINRADKEVMCHASSMVAHLTHHLYVLEDCQDHIEKGYKRVSQAHAQELEQLSNGLYTLTHEGRNQPNSMVQGVGEKVEQLKTVC